MFKWKGVSKKEQDEYSHRPQFGEFVQQGKMGSITDIVRGVLFSFIQKNCIMFKKKSLVFKYSRSENSLFVFILMLSSYLIPASKIVTFHLTEGY